MAIDCTNTRLKLSPQLTTRMIKHLLKRTKLFLSDSVYLIVLENRVQDFGCFALEKGTVLGILIRTQIFAFGNPKNADDVQETT